ncbi:hypothetical protein [Thermococcus pacificus]|uniref:Uncharacterized protein n=1 Tax=Thermococcus pacificus TaxID=71998 RepID=A0A218P9A5_9EURY|nr:hypothetical protein [Thermococcus pacificus]ASJ07320.1 hypothetical protein A3L08_08290 [Thermococcus pacificus]
MKRKNTTVEIAAPKEAVEAVLNDAPSFITNWPYVVRVSMKDGLKAEIMLPRFIFKFRDVYRFEYHSDYNSHIYDGTGEKGHISLVVTLKEWRKNTSAVLELSYKGKGEFWLGKTLQDFVEKIGSVLKEMAENRPVQEQVQVPAGTKESIAVNVDFADPMSVASFLSRSRMVQSGLHIIGEKGLFDIISELRATIPDRILYISGITSDGSSSFKVLLDGSRILAIEHRTSEGVEVVKVENDEDARRALEIASGIKGAYMVNVWVPIGGV